MTSQLKAHGYVYTQDGKLKSQILLRPNPKWHSLSAHPTSDTLLSTLLFILLSQTLGRQRVETLKV